MEWDAGEYGPYCMAVKVSFFPCLSGGMRACPQPCPTSPQKELGAVVGNGCDVAGRSNKKERKFSLLSFFSFFFPPSLLPLFCLLVLIWGGGGVLEKVNKILVWRSG